MKKDEEFRGNEEFRPPQIWVNRSKKKSELKRDSCFNTLDDYIEVVDLIR